MYIMPRNLKDALVLPSNRRGVYILPSQVTRERYLFCSSCRPFAPHCSVVRLLHSFYCNRACHSFTFHMEQTLPSFTATH